MRSRSPMTDGAPREQLSAHCVRRRVPSSSVSSAPTRPCGFAAPCDPVAECTANCPSAPRARSCRPAAGPGSSNPSSFSIQQFVACWLLSSYSVNARCRATNFPAVLPVAPWRLYIHDGMQVGVRANVRRDNEQWVAHAKVIRALGCTVQCSSLCSTVTASSSPRINPRGPAADPTRSPCCPGRA